jgi:hypothetical protein
MDIQFNSYYYIADVNKDNLLNIPEYLIFYLSITGRLQN